MRISQILRGTSSNTPPKVLQLAKPAKLFADATTTPSPVLERSRTMPTRQINNAVYTPRRMVSEGSGMGTTVKTHRHVDSIISIPFRLSSPDKSRNHTSPVTAFYKGESQGKKIPGDWKERTCSLSSPAHVMKRGSGVFLFWQIHVAVVTTPSACDARSRRTFQILANAQVAEIEQS